MLTSVSLDQLRAFIAAADKGSFSAAGRKLLRAQSVVSDLIAGLELQIGVRLFDRTRRYPELTAAGAVLLADARSIVTGVDLLKAKAKGIAGGIEPELCAVVDVFFPIAAVTEAVREFRTYFPTTSLRLFVEALGAAYRPLLEGSASVGVVGSLPEMPSSLIGEQLINLPFVMVAARDHPLAANREPIPRTELGKHVQVVLTDRSQLSVGREFGVISPSTWRVADLFAKHAFLLNGLGWGGMPLHVVQRDLDEGKLVTLPIKDMPPGGFTLSMAAVHAIAAPPGPAGRWLIERLKLCASNFAQDRRP